MAETSTRLHSHSSILGDIMSDSTRAVTRGSGWLIPVSWRLVRAKCCSVKLSYLGVETTFVLLLCLCFRYDTRYLEFTNSRSSLIEIYERVILNSAWCLFVRGVGFFFFFFSFLVPISVMDNFQEDSRRDKFSERAALKGTSNRVASHGVSLPPSLFRVKSVKRSQRP